MIKRFKYIIMLIKILVRSDKRFLVSLLGQSVCLVIIPFLQIALMNESVGFFENQASYLFFLKTILVLLVLILFISMGNLELESRNEVRANLISQNLYSEILSTCLRIDYEELQKKEVQEKKEMALKALDNAAIANLTRSFKLIVSSCVLIAGIIGMLLNVSLYLMLIITLVIIVNGCLSFKIKKKQYDADQELAPLVRQIDYFREIGSDFSTAKEVRLYDCRKAFLNQYRGLYRHMTEIVNRIVASRKNSALVAEIGNSLVDIVIYLILGYQLLVQKDISIAVFSAMLVAVHTFHQSMSRMIETVADLDNNAMHLKDYFEFITIPEKFSKKGKNPQSNQFEITFENVGFLYPNAEKFALRNINLTIHSGERISLVGENGSGKTTLIKLLMRLYDPTEGRILLNGVDIKEIAYDKYLQLFSTVFQDFKVYAFSIENNLTMFHEAEKDRIQSALDQVGILDYVNSLPKGLDTYFTTVFDKEGVELSGGQNQKLAIARAIMKDAPIFILDEPTAALDPRAEKEIFESFDVAIKNKTAIYISHRLSSCIISDYIFVLKNGSLIESGKHEELLERDGLYSELFRMQADYYIK